MGERRIRLFSKRHERAIFDRRLTISLPVRVRKRIWRILQSFNHEFSCQPNPYDNLNVMTDVLTEIEDDLKRRYGQDHLMAFDDAGNRVPTDLEGFIVRGYPAHVLDVVELGLASDFLHEREKLQRDINEILTDEGISWRIVDGQFFQVDSEFLSIELIARSYELLKSEGFEGALDELTEAKRDLAAEDYKGAIHNACKSFESALKTVLGREDGAARELIESLGSTSFYDDTSEDVKRGFGSTVLLSLPFLRNRMGGHGQGAAAKAVSRHYAYLAICLAASFNYFIVQRSLEIAKEADKDGAEPKADGHLDLSDIPF